MLKVQTKINGDAVVAAQTTQGCGCGGNATVSMTGLTSQQQDVAAAIQRVQKRKNSIYKTKTRLFM